MEGRVSMSGKRFQGHWKELLAEKRQPVSRGKEAKPVGKQQKSQGETNSAAATVKSAAKPPSEATAEADLAAASQSPVSAEYQAKLRAAALFGLSQRPQVTGEVEPPCGILAQVAPEVSEEIEEDPRFPRLRTALRAFHRYRYASLAVSLTALFVCLMVVHGHDGRPARVSVSGQVRLDGKPLTRGLVVFVPAQGRASTGSLDGQGRYVLTCFDGRDGAVPGRYRVEIAPDGVPIEGEPAWLVPARYSRCDTSELEINITDPTSDADFDLTSEGLKPPANAPEGPPPRDGERAPGPA